MTTLYANFLAGTITDAPLTAGATTINSSAFANLPVVTGPDIMYLVLDPDATAGAPEIVTVTAHTAAATSVTVTRASQSTTAREHAVSTVWRSAFTKADADQLAAIIADGAIDTVNLAADAVTTAKQDAAVANETGSNHTINTTIGTLYTFNVEADTDGVALVFLKGVVEATGVTFDPPGLAVVTAYLSVLNGVALYSNQAQLDSNTTVDVGCLWVVSLTAGTNTITVQGQRVNTGTSGGTVRLNSGAAAGVVGVTGI